MEVTEMLLRARTLAANSSADEEIKAAVIALANAVQRLEHDKWLVSLARDQQPPTGAA